MTLTLADLRPGDIMFSRHVRPWAADALILAGQLFLGQPGYPHHVAVVTRASSPGFEARRDGASGIGPMIVQAMPSGAEEVEIGAEHWTSDYIYIRPAYPRMLALGAGPDYDIGYDVADAACSYIDTPYSFLDYASITGVHLGIKNGPVRRYVTTSKHMICSQLADQAMSDAGWHVFDDGRLPQDVTPGALCARMLEMPGRYLIPGEAEWVDTIVRTS